MSKELDSLLKEERIFKPSSEVVQNSNIKKWMDNYNIKSYEELLEKAGENPEWFWDEIAGELEWFNPYNDILKWDPPHAEWFLDGKFNIVHNALDRHVDGPKKR